MSSGPWSDGPKHDLVVEKVRHDLLMRSQLGVQKYGTTLFDNKAPRQQRIQHAYEEALDLVNYLAWELMKTQGEKHVKDSNKVGGR